MLTSATQSSFINVDVPLKFASAAVKRVDNTKNYALRTYVPWSEFQLASSQITMPTGVSSRIILMYAEAVMSSSPAYRFLCFFRIVDHVLRVGGRKLRKLWKNSAQADWLELNGVLPADSRQHYDLDLVGKKFTEARNRYTETELRNAAAHVLVTTAAFEPLDPEHASHYRAAAAIFRFMSIVRLALCPSIACSDSLVAWMPPSFTKPFIRSRRASTQEYLGLQSRKRSVPGTAKIIVPEERSEEIPQLGEIAND